MSSCHHLCLHFFIGFGIFATKHFEAGMFLLDYRGKLIDVAQGDMIEDDTYVYFFQCGKNNFWYVHVTIMIQRSTLSFAEFLSCVP